MKKIFFILACMLTIQATQACPTKVTNDFGGGTIGLAEDDLGAQASAEQFKTEANSLVEAGQSSIVTPKEHGFFVYVPAKNGNGFVKKFEVVFNFCQPGYEEHMNYSDIQNRTIIIPADSTLANPEWKPGKFAVNEF